MHCSIVIIIFKESCLELEHMLITEGTEHSSRHTSTDCHFLAITQTQDYQVVLPASLF